MAEAKKRPWWVWPAVWMGLVFCFSSGVIFAGDFTNTVGKWLPIPDGVEKFRAFWHVTWWFWTKGFHVLEFSLLTWLGYTSLRNGLKKSLGASLGIAAAVAFCYACFDEWHQTFVPGRGGRVSDVMIDCGGILFAVIILALLDKKHQAKAQPS